ncbi:MAG: hypothetical protein ACXVZ2_01100 [Gaiellaceae bacterium]
MADALVYVAGAALILWGAMHIAPTTSVANSFGEISTDNRRILVMEWVAEGVTHISIGTLVILVAAVEGSAGPTAHLVYRVLAVALIALATLTAFTGARTPVIWFKACPFVLTGAAALLLAASAL